VTALYICYQSIGEPLTQTQVIAYLEGLASAHHRLLLLTFEPATLKEESVPGIRDRLQEKGIEWHSLRYHKRPTLPATAWDILTGIACGLHLVRQCKIQLIHARSHVPGLIGVALKRLTGARLLFDVRGLMAEEYVDAGVWPANGLLFRVTKYFERVIVDASDGLVVLTKRGRTLLNDWYDKELSGKPLLVIPCCVDLRRAPANAPRPDRALTLAYAGKLGGWYLTEQILSFFAIVKRALPGSRFEIWTQSDIAPIEAKLREHNIAIETCIGYCGPGDLLTRLSSHCDAAIAFIAPCLSKQSSSPTKIAEYLSAGLPVVINPGIGDLDDLIGRLRVGVTVTAFNDAGFELALQQLLRLLAERDLQARCRQTAAEYFDLRKVGWASYRHMYELLQPA
jgi:glycosyltransferase involved in cell wall biosynthesis